jgi:hypothetical protein
MRLVKLLIIAVTAMVSSPVYAQSSDDDLRVYAVSVINVAPFKRPFSGYGIYLGQNAIITAAHVVGHWSLFENPTIIIAGQEISAKVIKKGSFPQLDLALLAVQDASLPVSLRLRQNPLCKALPDVGKEVVVVYPERTVRSRIISAQTIATRYRSHFGTLISEQQGSGSGVFDADKKCLFGIMSAAVTTLHDFMSTGVARFDLQGQNGRVGYFVPASTIATFIPAHLRF